MVQRGNTLSLPTEHSSVVLLLWVFTRMLKISLELDIPRGNRQKEDKRRRKWAENVTSVQ